MRITAIRGQGLASLFDPFEVLLDEGPLAQSGLYCIAGQTGAGKSTILDAMCLALFGETPRLTGRSKSKIGRVAPGQDDLRISDRDPRALLSRGCAEGFAEVEFVGVDQEKYRARWSVRRSRRSSTGRLQKATVQLERVADAKVLSDHPTTKTLLEISNKLGLSFEQFCRSVLLAQGDFSAFLRADDKERADLLERMTGTEVYRKLSKACHQRNREEQAQAQSAKEAVAKLEIWDDETLAQKETEKEQVKSQLAKAQANVSVQRTLKAALERRALLQQRLDQAKEAQALATGAWEQAQPERDQLAQLMAVHELRPLHEQRKTLQAKVIAAQESLSQTQKNLAQAKEAASKASLEVQRTQAQLEQRQSEHRSKATQLRAAQALDLEIGQINDAHAEQVRKVREQELAVKKLQTRKQQCDASIKALDVKLSQLDREWPEFERSQELVKRKDELCEVFDDLLALQQKHLEKQRAIETQVQEQSRLKQEQASLQAKMASLKAEMSQIKAWSPEQELQQSQRLKALGEASKQCQGALGLAGQLEALHEEYEKLDTQRKELGAEQKELGAQVERNQRAIELGQKKCAELDIRRDEARQLRDEAHAQQVMLQHRDLLREGSPCPLCGSLEHPIVGQEQSTPPDAFALATKRLETLERDRKAQGVELVTLEKTDIALRTRIEASTGALRTLEEQRKGHGPELERRKLAMQTALGQLHLSFDDLLSKELAVIRETAYQDTRSRASDRVQALTGLYEKVELAQAKLNQLIAEDTNARAQQRVLREQLERINETERALSPKLAKVGVAVASLHSEDEALVERSKALRGRLSALWKGTPGPWSSKVSSLPELHTRVLAWLEAMENAIGQRKAWEETRQRQVLERGEQDQQCTLEQKRLEDLLTTQQESMQKRSKAQSQRASLLDGISTDRFLEAFERACAELSSENQKAKERYDLQSNAATRQLALSEGLREQVGQLEQELDQATARFERALGVLGVPRAEAQAALAVPKARVEAMQKAQQVLDQALRDAKALVKSRSEDLADDKIENETLAPATEIQAALDRAIEQLEQTQRKLVEIEHSIESNADKISQREALADAHRSQLEKAKCWAQLNALIGHSEGLSFQRFAQGLSLDRLLLLANQHLQDIDRRYRLSRVHGDSLDLQVVDTMMGDEIRSMHSLSGGESFLISLALALGLSSLSAMHTKVESLFIDEGFGTLDRESLEQVLCALDALQASGRQVGLISHVEGMAEQLGARVQVRPMGHGKSRIEVQGAHC